MKSLGRREGNNDKEFSDAQMKARTNKMSCDIAVI